MGQDAAQSFTKLIPSDPAWNFGKCNMDVIQRNPKFESICTRGVIWHI
jgi:hypothetical protein